MAEGGKLQTTSPQWTFSPTNPMASARSITILVELYLTKNGKILEMGALINSRATICYINLNLVRRMKWLLEKLH